LKIISCDFEALSFEKTKPKLKLKTGEMNASE